MKNFIFISPNFPENYYMFIKELKNNGLRVLGIGDAPFDDLSYDLKQDLHEYYKVSSLQNYDEVYRAVAFFIHKYGRIDFLESNNEFWLEQDAKLRTDFNITTGFKTADIEGVKYKSKMKKFYEEAGVPVARYHIVDTLENCKAFIEEVGYPVFCKPDNGVGASDTYKISNEEDLNHFFEVKSEHEVYIMEEFIDATVTTYDAIYNSKNEPIFETGNVTVHSLSKVVNEGLDSLFYIRKDNPEDILRAGRATAKAHNVRSRMVHFEFFRLNCDQAIGKKGDVVALEVNMRPSGGISPSMMNYAHSVNVYKIWADMIAFDSSEAANSDKHEYCAFIGRRDGRYHHMSDEEVYAKYGDNLKMAGRVADALSGAMGNQMFVANFDTYEQMEEYYNDLMD